MAAWADFFPYILPVVRGCDEDVATFHVRQAAIEFCRRSQAWRQELSGLTSIADVAGYSLVPVVPVGSTISKLLAFAVVNTDGVADDCYALTTPQDGRSNDRNYSIGNYAYLSDDALTLYVEPVPTDDGLALMPYVSLKPTQASVTFPDALFEQYVGTIAAGALASLLSMPKTDWHSLVDAGNQRAKFLDETGSAAAKVSRGSARSTRRGRAVFF